MTLRCKLILMTVITTALISGCRIQSPADKPFVAGEYMRQAQISGAAEFAPEEYRRLQREFTELEELYLLHRHEVLNARLPAFAQQVSRLAELARQNNSKAETVVPIPLTVTDAPRPRSAKGTAKTTSKEQLIAKPRLSYTVCEGDLLWSIAKRPDIYGDPHLWPLLYQANRDQIKDPRKIYAGQTLSIPINSIESEREDARNQSKSFGFFP